MKVAVFGMMVKVFNSFSKFWRGFIIPIKNQEKFFGLIFEFLKNLFFLAAFEARLRNGCTHPLDRCSIFFHFIFFDKVIEFSKLNMTNEIYVWIATIANVGFLYYTYMIFASNSSKASLKLFAYSIFYLFALFLGLLILSPFN